MEDGGKENRGRKRGRKREGKWEEERGRRKERYRVENGKKGRLTD